MERGELSDHDGLSPAIRGLRGSAKRSAVIGLGLIAAAIALLFALDVLEQRWLHELPWHSALRTLDYKIEDEEAITVWSWGLAPAQSVGDSKMVQLIQGDLLDMIALKETDLERLKKESPVVALSSTDMLNEAVLPKARLVMFDSDSSIFEAVLVSGRLPVAGEREVLAGPLVSERPLVIGGESYTVVGRLYPHVSGFTKAFVMPNDPELRAELDGALAGLQGSVHLEGMHEISDLIPELMTGDSENVPVLYGGRSMTRLDIAWGVWFALLLVAAGATLSFMALYRYLATRDMAFLNVTLREIERRRRLLWGLYLTLFFGFFAAMALGLMDVEMNYFFTEVASHQFNDGGLKYVGDAYKSGNIPLAAWATFRNNFVFQTVILGAFPSLLLLGIGVLKTLASFVVVGFAMAPVWSGTASGMTYHAITLALELPPYVLAAFGMLVWALAVFSFLWSPIRVWYLGDKAEGIPIIEDAYRQLPRAFLVLVGTVTMAGVFLAIAACYEATTLILLR